MTKKLLKLKKAIELITSADKVLTFDDDGNSCVGEVVCKMSITMLGGNYAIMV